MDKVDWERGTLDQHGQPNSSRPSRAYLRLLRLAGFFGVALLVHRFWPATILHRCYPKWQIEPAHALDDLCPQAEVLTPLGHEALLASLDEEFDTSEFKLKAYESLSGAVRIP